MFDVFTEEIEVMIKDGIANLYWYKADLKKAWLRSTVDIKLCESLFARKNIDGNLYTKRQLMDLLYEELRTAEYNKRLEISRNFVRLLFEQKSFVPQERNHRIEVAERCALKLRRIYDEQEKQRHQVRHSVTRTPKETYYSQLSTLQERFQKANTLKGQVRGYELEKLFTNLMKISGIPVEKPFKIEGEQIDGAIKYEGHFYLIELKWVRRQCNQSDIGSFYMKVEGKMDGRGIFIAMDGYSKELLANLPKGKDIRVLLIDGVHFSNVIFGNYTFQELVEHAIKYASLRGEIYCPTTI